MNWYISIYYFLYIYNYFIDRTAASDICNVNGVLYRSGQVWTTMPETKLLKCKCLGNGKGQWNCQYTIEDAFLIAADSSKIVKVTLGGNKGYKHTYIEQLQGHTVATDVDLERDYVFWTDVSFKNRGIYRAKYSDGSQIVRIISSDIYEPNGMSVDWVAKNIYWTDAQLGAIFVASEDGKHRTMVLGGLSEPRSIVVVPLHGIMFWSDQSDGAIYKAKMDGTDKKIVIPGLEWPNEIAVDTKKQKIYWVDAKRHMIESCNFNGFYYKPILNYTLTTSNSAFGLSLFNDRLYFSVWNEKSIFSITTLGQDLTRVVTGMTDLPSGITIINKNMQQLPISKAVGPCQTARKTCSHICLPISRSEYTCSCPDRSGLVLSRDRRSCLAPDEFILFTSLEDGTIMLVSQQFGAPRQPFLLERSDQPSAIAYDPTEKRVYWSDVSKNVIYRMFLNATKKEIFLEDGIGIVDGIAIDWGNRHLYFTNYGYGAGGVEFHRIELINLNGKERKIITYSDLEKPRDVVIDQQRGFLYYSDWGTNAKVVRVDLDGKNPHVLSVHVENPNGLALQDTVLYITDSHHRSALMQINGTVVYGNPPSLIKYDTRLHKDVELNDLNMEIPFGASVSNEKLFVTDWGLEAVSEYDTNTGQVILAASGFKKPTGIVYANTLSNRIIVSECVVSNPCSHTCVNVDTTHYSCMCPDKIGYALSENKLNCVVPDQFILVADVDKIIMKSQSPLDNVPYAVVQTFDDYSNIVAVTYDPQTQHIYWADNGRQRISRKAFGYAAIGTSSNVEVIYTDIGRVEGMAIDAENQLLYWTDAELGTIEVLQLRYMTHATVLQNLIQPRAIALDPHMGVMYWTEQGMRPTVQTALMNGQVMRMFVNTPLHWPNALMFDTDDNSVYLADGGIKKIQQLSALEGDTLGYMNMTKYVDHIYGVGKIGRAVVYTDWYKKALISTDSYETKMLIRNMSRPSQIYVHTTFIPKSVSQCTTSVHECSHICVPSPGSYRCLCPDNLVLSDNLRMCVRPEELYRYTSTLAPPTTQAVVEETTADYGETTVADYDDDDLEAITLGRITVTTVQPNDTEAKNTTGQTEQPTTAAATTIAQTTTAPPPTFKNCPTEQLVANLPIDNHFIEITVEDIGVEAYDGEGNKLNPFIASKVQAQLLIGEHVVDIKASDVYARVITCEVKIKVQDITPPAIVYCPKDLEIESYSYADSAYVTWDTPKFHDNSDGDVTLYNSHTPGHYPDGLNNVTYRAVDPSGNVAVCSFLIAVLHLSATCGEPWTPPRSYLTCHTDKTTQEKVCQISCEKEYRLTLQDPYIKCKMNSEKSSPTWMPFLDENVCKKPTIGNPQQEIQLQYPSPCDNSTWFYGFTFGIFKAHLRREADCDRRRNKLGFCLNPDQKLQLLCVAPKKLNVSIKVDLAVLDGIETTSQAVRIVKRSATEILDMALTGKIKTRGFDMKDYKADGEAMALTAVNIICMSGYKSVDNGCVACPKGTYWENNNCPFCPLHMYQQFPASMNCFNCPEGTGTETIGASNELNCQSMVAMSPVRESNNIYIIVGGTIGGVIIALAILIFIGFLHKRKKKKQMEKALRRKKMEAKRRRQRKNSEGSVRRRESRRKSSRNKSIGSGTELGSRTSSKRSIGSKRVTISEHKTEHKIPHRDDLKDMDLKLAAWKNAISQKRNPSEFSSDSRNKRTTSVTTDDQSVITATNTEVESTIPASDVSVKSQNQTGSVTSDLGEETLSCTSSRTTTPIKGVLKKPRQRVRSTDDTLSVISGSSIMESVPNPRRGREIKRNESQRLPATNAGHEGLSRVRSSSLDRVVNMPPQKMNNDPRFLTLQHPMRQPPQGLQQPPPDYHAIVQGTPRMIRPAPQPMMYRMPPNQRMPNQRMPFMPMRPAGPVRPQPRVRMPPGPPPGHFNPGYWNNGYDTQSDWDSMSMMSTDTDIRPRHMPPRMMVPRYRGMRPRHPQMPPHAQFVRGPRRY